MWTSNFDSLVIGRDVSELYLHRSESEGCSGQHYCPRGRECLCNLLRIRVRTSCLGVKLICSGLFSHLGFNRLGPIPWLIVAEMFSGKYVAAAMGVSSQLNWACNFIVG